MLGATGTVGGQAVQTLLQNPNLERLTLLGRKPVDGISFGSHVCQEEIDVFDSDSYTSFLSGHDTAICTLGVGQPSKISKEGFIKIDKTAVLDFVKECKRAGVLHFELLASVGISANSSTFYLRIKRELVEAIKALNFERLSIFKPSMILTPINRYGFSQAFVL